MLDRLVEKPLIGPILNQVDCLRSALHVIAESRRDSLYGECFVTDVQDIASHYGRVNRWDRMTIWVLAMQDANRRLNLAKSLANFRQALE